jgi:nitrite reductase (cytochrome c-552)
MKSITQLIEQKPWMAWVLFVATMVIVFFVGLLAASVIERRTEAVFVNVPKTEVSQFEPRNAVWGANYPREYQSYYQTADTTFASKYNGNKMIDMLKVDPRLVVLWAGYAFSKDYSQGRGHFYAIEDIRNTLRTGAPKNASDGPQPSTCMTCKSPDVPRMMNLEGVEGFYKGKWARLGAEVVNPIGCADCHDAKTMNLHISRPALIETFQRQGKDITKVSHQEMRTLVCAQCHVEYYFDKHRVEGAAYLTFPWDKGMNAESIERYYDELEFSDWTHQLSKAPMLKAQHPEYETYSMGIHAERGVSCADCHMPYKSEGGQKFTDHHIQSPLNNIANSCQVCHREETAKLVKNVYDRQDKIISNRDRLEELLVHTHVEAQKAWELGATDAEMKEILQGIRHAQWRWDFSAASHGASFHAPVEIGRVISSGIDLIGETRVKLARLLAAKGFNREVPYPEIGTKEKAQEFIGLDMNKLKAEKDTFKRDLLQKWIREADQREKSWGEKVKS